MDSFKLDTPMSTVIWANTERPDKFDRHTISLLITPEWKDFLHQVEMWMVDDLGIEHYEESWITRPVSNYAVENFEDVVEGDQSIQFTSKSYALKKKPFPVYVNDSNDEKPHNILGGVKAKVRTSFKPWAFNEKEGLSCRMNKIRVYQEVPDV